VVRGPRENGHRPEIDPLFRTAAVSYGRRVVGAVLSGTLDDGTAGLAAIKERGGVAIVQDPDDALYPGMPRSALEAVAVDHRLPAADIAETLARLAADPSDPAGDPPIHGDMELESAIAAFEPAALEDDRRPGTPSGFACPDCGGSLWEIEEGELTRFRCRVGHAWAAGSLVAEQAEAVEAALWTAFRALEERAALCRRITARFEKRHGRNLSARFARPAAEAKRRAEVLRQVLMTEPVVNAELPGRGEAPIDG
jgi:two-component system chemotaxis response regulator CheB